MSDAEREVLNKLTGSGGEGHREKREEPEEVRHSEGSSVEPPRAGPLTEAEWRARRAVVQESGRIMREDFPEMFPPRGAELSGFEEETEGKREVPGERRGLSRIGAHAVEVLGYPARRLGTGVVTGLGLAGVILLMTLLVVILVRVLGRG